MKNKFEERAYLEVADGLHSSLCLLCGGKSLVLFADDLGEHGFDTRLSKQNILPGSGHEILQSLIIGPLFCRLVCLRHLYTNKTLLMLSMSAGSVCGSSIT